MKQVCCIIHLKYFPNREKWLHKRINFTRLPLCFLSPLGSETFFGHTRDVLDVTQWTLFSKQTNEQTGGRTISRKQTKGLKCNPAKFNIGR